MTTFRRMNDRKGVCDEEGEIREEKIVEGDNFFLFHFFFKSKEREETSGVSKSIRNRKWSTGVAKLEQQSQRGEANKEKSECVKKHRKKNTAAVPVAECRKK